MKKLLYVGPSWAVRSFSQHSEDYPQPGENYTNLALELELDVVNLAQFGFSNQRCLNIIKNYNEPYDGIIWIYCEPIKDLDKLGHPTVENYLQSQNHLEIRLEISQKILRSANELGQPIAVIGAHSDVENYNLDNITIIHPSWQQFLSNSVNISLNSRNIGWGAEVAQNYIGAYKNIKPAVSLVELTYDTLSAWEEMEKQQVFCGCHPSRKGNELFAKHIQKNVQSWLSTL